MSLCSHGQLSGHRPGSEGGGQRAIADSERAKEAPALPNRVVGRREE